MSDYFSLKSPPEYCPIGGIGDFSVRHIYRRRPDCETAFDIKGRPYYRELWQNNETDHFISLHDLGLESLYDRQYAMSKYGELKDIHDKFLEIHALPPDKSDNFGRVKAIKTFLKSQNLLPLENGGVGERKKILDVGSGLCVFLAGFCDDMWQGTALDPDPLQAEHARKLGFKGVACDFMKSDFQEKFDLITFNKVLEHVYDPIGMLKYAIRFLTPSGVIYIELPDCTAAWHDKMGPLRQEFIIEHIHGFTEKSVQILVEKSGLNMLDFQKIHEASDKYTMRAFLQQKHI